MKFITQSTKCTEFPIKNWVLTENPHLVVFSPLLHLIMSPQVYKGTYPYAGFYPASKRHQSASPQNSGKSQQHTGSSGVLSLSP